MSDLDYVRRRLEELRSELKVLNKQITDLKKDEKTCKRNFDVVVSSAYCPVCLQPLSLEYKHEYSEKIGAIVRDIERRIYRALERQKALEQEISNLEEAIHAKGAGSTD